MQWIAEHVLLSPLRLCSFIKSAVVYWLHFLVEPNNRVFWSQPVADWCSRSRTKRPWLCFIDVSMWLSWQLSESELYSAVTESHGFSALLVLGHSVTLSLLVTETVSYNTDGVRGYRRAQCPTENPSLLVDNVMYQVCSPPCIG